MLSKKIGGVRFLSIAKLATRGNTLNRLNGPTLDQRGRNAGDNSSQLHASCLQTFRPNQGSIHAHTRVRACAYTRCAPGTSSLPTRTHTQACAHIHRAGAGAGACTRSRQPDNQLDTSKHTRTLYACSRRRAYLLWCRFVLVKVEVAGIIPQWHSQ